MSSEFEILSPTGQTELECAHIFLDRK